MRKSNDIETVLYQSLYDYGYSASAHAVPASLGDALPHVHVVRTGGFTSDLVIEHHNVDFDVYADDPAEAMTAACNLCDWVRNLVGSEFYSSEITTLPYGNPDPRHSTLARVTFKALILTRTKGA